MEVDDVVGRTARDTANEVDAVRQTYEVRKPLPLYCSTAHNITTNTPPMGELIMIDIVLRCINVQSTYCISHCRVLFSYSLLPNVLSV